MKGQGIVLKIEKRIMVVITEDGEFLELPLPKSVPALGAKIFLPATPPVRKLSRLALVASFLVLILSLSIFRPLLMPQAVAAVTFDLPIGLELGVDTDNRVVKIIAKDHISQNLIEDLELKGVDIYLAANQIVQATKEMETIGLEEEEIAFMVTVMPLKSRGKMNLDHRHLHEQLRQELDRQEFTGYLILQDSEEDPRIKAAELGLPVGKYLLWERNQQGATEFYNIEELKALPTEALVSLGEEDLERNFPGMWCRVGKRGEHSSGHSPMHYQQKEIEKPVIEPEREKIIQEESKEAQSYNKERKHGGFMPRGRRMQH